MSELPEGFDSIFRYIAVVSQRAEQIISGAKVRCDSRHGKPTMQAKDDVDSGMVDWRVLTQEELDAQRQAIVEQFRAEVGADDYRAIAAPGVAADAGIPHQKPEVTAPDQAREEKDDELARLQRLLGLAGPPPEETPTEPAPVAEATSTDGDADNDDLAVNDEPAEEVSLEEAGSELGESASFDDENEENE
jgi:DNA-directed RNA polymerase subunit K/omega